MKERRSADKLRNHLVVISFAVGWLVFLVKSADACSCGGPSPVCIAYGHAAAVFLGRVSEIIPPRPMLLPRGQPNDGDRHEARANRPYRPATGIPMEYPEMAMRIRFAVEEVFAGEGKSEIEVQTNIQSSACGRSFTLGESYLVYAQRINKTGPLITTSCDRTQLAAQAREDLAFLRALPLKGSGGNLEIALSQLGEDPQPFVPLVGIRILVASDEHSVETITDAAGRSHLEALPAGRYLVHAVLPDPMVEAYPPREIQVNDGGCSTQRLFARRKER